MELSGWGRYPRMQAHVELPLSKSECAQAVHRASPLIARGWGRSYGDSALGREVLSTRHLDHFEAFDAVGGLLTCAAGISLDAILSAMVPRGWFLPVTPGTRFVSLGGAIASDVHGKNHHRDGTLSAHLERIELLLGNGERVFASPSEHPELFRATCGGMGLTGVIVSASLRLRRIASSDIIQTVIRLRSLDEALEAFEANAACAYSVAWIDCLAGGASLGRSLLMLGDHATDGPLAVQSRRPLPVPFDLPAGLLNRGSARAFNALYYGRVWRDRVTSRIPFEPFFYPLDALSGWNRLYGKPGFVQYQCVLPAAAGLREVLACVAGSGRGAFLAVLKLFGAANASPLSFPMQGYTLALDFRAEPQVFELLDALDRIVLFHGGRLYLAKDARMTESTFKASYPRWDEFEQVRARWYAHGKFASAQSLRLGLA